MSVEVNLRLASETAETLLTAIKNAISDANQGNHALKELAEAYALARGALPKPDRIGRIS